MSRKGRSLLERAEAIMDFVDKNTSIYTQEEGIPKSDFQEVGISPRDIDQWLDLIEYIQQAPLLRVTRDGRYTSVQQVENRFMQYLRTKITDRKIEFLQRRHAAMMYLRVMVNIEKSMGEEINWKDLIEDPWEISRPTIVRLVEEFEED